MKQGYCPNCKRKVLYKRYMGIGTLILFLATGGLWLLVIPFYKKRCKECGDEVVKPASFLDKKIF